MDNRVYLKRYRLSVGRNGLPVELHRAPTSVTYRAQEIATGREVALERVTADTSDAGFRELLESEAAVAKKISQLNIPALYDFGFEEGELIFVTEHFDGRTAATWVGARGPLSTAATLRVALQVVAAMDAMAFHRIYHHALNPDNIVFLNAETEARDWPPLKVLHWLGVAPLFAEAGDPRLESAARFASPEQLYTGRVDVRSEVYSLGCTMWFLLTGAPPVLTTEPGARAGLPATRELDHVPKIVRHLILRMLRPEPDERPQDPVALNAFLQTCLARVERKEKGRPGAAVPFVGQGQKFKRARKLPFAPRPMALAAGLVALALLAAFAVPRLIGTKSTARTESRSNQAALASRNEMARLPKRTATVVTPTHPKTEPPSSDSDPIVEVPRESAGIPAGAVAGEPQPPEEGPSEQDNAPVVVENVPLTTSPEVSEASAATAPARENETPEASASAPAVVAKNPPPPVEENAPPASTTAESAPIVTARNEPSRTTSLQDTIASAAPLTNQAPGAQPEEQDETSADPAAMTEDESNQIAADDSQSAASIEEAAPAKKSPAVAAASATPAVKKSRSAAVAKGRVKPKTKAPSVARKSNNKTPSRKRVATSAVPRAQKLPELHFGSSRAELVGTTRSGQWILSVKSTGKKVIVPPPPGFVQK